MFGCSHVCYKNIVSAKNEGHSSKNTENRNLTFNPCRKTTSQKKVIDKIIPKIFKYQGKDIQIKNNIKHNRLIETYQHITYKSNKTVVLEKKLYEAYPESKCTEALRARGIFSTCWQHCPFRGQYIENC